MQSALIAHLPSIQILIIHIAVMVTFILIVTSYCNWSLTFSIILSMATFRHRTCEHCLQEQINFRLAARRRARLYSHLRALFLVVITIIFWTMTKHLNIVIWCNKHYFNAGLQWHCCSPWLLAEKAGCDYVLYVPLGGAVIYTRLCALHSRR